MQWYCYLLLDPEKDTDYWYNLIGVVVHTGTAEGGHYYSFIRNRSNPQQDQWFLFNDAEVKPFDPSQIASECFGGEMTVRQLILFLSYSYYKQTHCLLTDLWCKGNSIM